MTDTVYGGGGRGNKDVELLGKWIVLILSPSSDTEEEAKNVVGH